MNDKKLGGLYGALIGDACGCHYEFKRPSSIPPLNEIEMVPPVGYKRTWDHIPVGTYTDDGAQTLCLLETLLSGSELVSSLRTKLVAWLGAGYKSVDNFTFDVGSQTRMALEYCHSPSEVAEKLSEERHSGNGSLMRCVPVALLATSLDDAISTAARQSLATHPNNRCQISCAIYAGIAYEMLQGKEADDVTDYVIERVKVLRPDALDEIKYIVTYEGHELTGSGYVVDCLWSSLLVLRLGHTYKEVIQHAIALGNDTDTTACVAGGLAGIKFGYSALPADWLDLLRGKDLIEPLARQLT